MPVQQARDLGFRGIDLGIDAAKSRALVLGDGVRFDKVGVLKARLGRKRAGLDFPYEGYGTSGDYVENVPQVIASDRVRGYVPYFDQRIVTRAPQILDDTSFNDSITGASPLPWTAGSGWSFTSDSHPYLPSRVTYTHSGAGNLTQAASAFLSQARPGKIYKLEYTILTSTFSGTLQLTTTFASPAFSLSTTVGPHSYVFFSHPTSITAFTLDVTVSTSGAFTLTSLSLREFEQNGAHIIPERMNLVYKAGTEVVMNNGAALTGDKTFGSRDTRAQLTVHGGAVYITDESSKPKLLRRLPVEEQAYLDKVLYDVRPAMDWPTESTGFPDVVASSPGGFNLPAGTYRFRVAVENKFGDESQASLPGSAFVDKNTARQRFVVSWAGMVGGFPTEAVKVRLYVQFTADGTASQEPSAYTFIKNYPLTYKSNAADPTGSMRYEFGVHSRLSINEILRETFGAPPRFRAFTIVDSIGYGIPAPDFITVEDVISKGETVNTTGTFNAGGPFNPRLTVKIASKRVDNTAYKRMRVDPSMLMVSLPGEPFAMHRFIRFGDGGEVGVALWRIGHKVAILTNADILVYDPATDQLERTFSEVGTSARDSVQDTEGGVVFLGGDFVPRNWNGALVDHNFRELAPVFQQEDFQGAYKRFDRQFASQVTSTYGNSRLFMCYPVATNPGPATANTIAADSGGERNLAVLDTQHGRKDWTIDRSGYEEVRWVPELARLLAVNESGEFYYIEEGLVDENVLTSPDSAIAWRAQTWLFASAEGQPGRFYRLAIEYDSKGTDLTVIVTVDGVAELTQSFVLNSTVRTRRVFPLPGTFKGRYLSVEFQGTVGTGRPEVYDVQIESRLRGVF